MFSIGELVGSYRIVAPLGQGGMATVFKAYHPKLDRYVALKFIHQSFLSDPQFVTRFEREAQIIAQLEHPNIVPVHDFAEHEGQPYLVMKYISGISLADALDEGPLELRDIMAIVPKIAAALDYAHARNILHRDIKPSNIMLDESGTPYLTDFGLARTVEAGQSSLSRGLLIGTPAYMSPEQGEGLRELDARSDLYSFGIVLYELIVGKVPFDSGTTFTILRDHLMTPLPLPSSINPEIPAAVDAVLIRALSKDPADRYESAVEMAAALREAFVQSQVKRLSSGKRHTVAVSLAERSSQVTPPVPQRTPAPSGLKAETPPSRPGGRKVPLPVALGTLALILVVAVALVALAMRMNRRAQVRAAVENLPTLVEDSTNSLDQPEDVPVTVQERVDTLPTAIPPTDIPPTATVTPTQLPTIAPPRRLLPRLPRDGRP